MKFASKTRITMAGLLAPFILLLVIGDNLNYNQNEAPSMAVSAIPFNAIVPNLSTGWFHKPGPAESIVFGLIVLKVIALRMAGVFPYNLNELLQDGGYLDRYFLKAWTTEPESITNDIDIAEKKIKKRTERDLYFMNKKSSSAPAMSPLVSFAKLLTPQGPKFTRRSHAMSKLKFGNKKSVPKSPLLKEIDTIERILLGLRRIDSHDCFIRHVCQINQNRLAGTASPFDEAMLKVFSLKPPTDSKVKAKSASTSTPSIWDIYHDALMPSVIDCGQKYQMCPLSSEEMSPINLLDGLF